MNITTQLDVNLIALDTDDEVTVMLDLEAPPLAADLVRPAASLQVVLDRSGSMSGAPLEGAKDALIALVRRLAPTDNFGLVTFDNEAQVVVPAGPLTDKESVIAKIRQVASGGSTDLGAGLLRGLREIKRVATAGGTLLVVSDGHINAGIRDAGELSGVAARAYGDGIVISTLGYGEHYDETLLAALAKAGAGNHVFASNPDDAGAEISREVTGLLTKALQAMTLTVELEPSVKMVRLYNDLPAAALPGGRIMIEIGDLYADEKRRLLLKLKVPGKSTLGPAKVATLALEYIELPALIEHVAKLPIAVNVVPGSEAAERLSNPIVVSETLFQEAQECKKLASEAFENDHVSPARDHLARAKSHLVSALSTAPASSSDDIRREIATVEQMIHMADRQSTRYMSKLSRSSYHEMNRKRGRSEEPNVEDAGTH
ncbi:hypothetical protein GCM10009860_15350 [Microbacterium mitrae]|uniref:VWA domain-containing protein n=1 Tax=Microbacterium mitrae TaxID=664640 RepID=A0A5C8HLV3_9MICO|nr:VWA domain-containing protein [Microbacterium mitrae]TXK03387.1 VWA domain-containing protein [Microbacterium mitrae]